MLEEHGITAASSRKEAGAKMDIHQHHGDSTRQYGHHRDQKKGGNEPSPDKQWHLHIGHAGRAHIHHRGDDVDRAHDR